MGISSQTIAMPEVMEFYRMAGDVDYMLRVVVADTGIGMSEEFQKHLFEPFAQELLDARSIQDDTQRAAVYDHIGQVLSEERPYIPMWSYNNLVGASKTQEGFQMNPVSAYRYENVVVYE